MSWPLIVAAWVGLAAGFALWRLAAVWLRERADLRRAHEIDAWVIAWTRDARREGWL